MSRFWSRNSLNDVTTINSIAIHWCHIHLDSHRSPIKQLCFVNLGQTGCSYGLVLKRFKKLLRCFVKVFLEESVHLLQKQKQQSSLFHPVLSGLVLQCGSDLFVLPVQGLVFQDLQSVDVFGGQEVVERTQTLAQFDVYSPILCGAIDHALCRPPVARWHLGKVGWAALAGEVRGAHEGPFIITYPTRFS